MRQSDHLFLASGALQAAQDMLRGGGGWDLRLRPKVAKKWQWQWGSAVAEKRSEAPPPALLRLLDTLCMQR